MERQQLGVVVDKEVGGGGGSAYLSLSPSSERRDTMGPMKAEWVQGTAFRFSSPSPSSLSPSSLAHLWLSLPSFLR